MYTVGGMKLIQFIILSKLLKNGSVDLTLDIIEQCNLNCINKDGILPSRLVLGHSE